MRTADRTAGGRRSSENVASSGCPAETGGRPETGSRPEIEYLAIGRVSAPRGVRGELRVDVETEDPERFRILKRVYLGEEYAPYRVLSGRVHRGQALLLLEGVTDRNTAEGWRGAYVYVAIDDALPLREGEYYYHQIIGLEALTEEGEALGRVTEVLVTGANDVYVIQGPRGEVLFPALEGVVLRIDLANGRMTVRIPEGLL